MKDSGFEKSLIQDVMIAVFLAGLGCAVYAGAVFHPFVHDDFPLVADNPVLRHWDWPAMFIRRMDFGVAADLSRPYYRPMLDVINRIIFSVSGPNPAVFHGFNVILHVVNGWLVFRILETVLKIFGKHPSPARWTALAAAVLFVVHPVQTQAVACVSGISSLAMTFFCLLAFWFFLGSTGVPLRARYLRLSGMGVMFVLALLCKEQALVLPGLILGHVWMAPAGSGQEKRGHAMAKLTALFAGLTVIYLVWKKFFVGVPTFAMDPTAGGALRILSIPHVFLVNFRILFFPDDLHYFRSLDLLADHRLPAMIVMMGLTGGIYLMRFLEQTDRRLILWGLGWFAAAQIATIQIVPLFWEYSRMSTAEHFLYLPSIGMFLAVCVLGRNICQRVSRPVRTGIRAGIITGFIVLTALTVVQIRYWSSETVLFERAVRYEPQLGRLQHILAQAYFHQGKYAESAAADQKALKIMERYESVAVGAEAQAYYRTIRTDVMMSLGLASRMMKDMPSAVNWMKQALELDPDHPGNQSTLGVMYAEQGDYENARRHLARAVALAPDHPDYLRNMGVLLSLSGQNPEARGYFEKALEINPSDAAARTFLEGLKKDDQVF